MNVLNATFNHCDTICVVLLQILAILKNLFCTNLSETGQLWKVRVRVGSGNRASQNFRVGYGSGNLSLYSGSGQIRVG